MALLPCGGEGAAAAPPAGSAEGVVVALALWDDIAPAEQLQGGVGGLQEEQLREELIEPKWQRTTTNMWGRVERGGQYGGKGGVEAWDVGVWRELGSGKGGWG